MKRRVMRFATAISLLLCVAVAVVMLRSFRVTEVWQGGRRISQLAARQNTVQVSWGVVLWTRITVRIDQDGEGAEGVLSRAAEGHPLQSLVPPVEVSYARGGFYMTQSTDHPRSKDFAGKVTRYASAVAVPLWSIMLVLLVLPAGQAWRFALTRIRARRRGRCRRCRYSLTGNSSGVCSECGLAVS